MNRSLAIMLMFIVLRAPRFSGRLAKLFTKAYDSIRKGLIIMIKNMAYFLCIYHLVMEVSITDVTDALN